MKSVRFFGSSFVRLLIFVSFTFSTGCNENVVGPVQTIPKPAIEITLDPKDGKLGVDGECIKITFSREPSMKGWEGELKSDKGVIAGYLDFKTKTSGEYCPFSLLKQGLKYSFTLKIKEPEVKGLKQRTFEVSTNYKTESPYLTDDVFKEGFTVNLKLGDLIVPKGFIWLASSTSADDIHPILLYLFKRDKGRKGALTFVGGLGKEPKGQKPHKGKDLVDTKTPESVLFTGTFAGRLFALESSFFSLHIVGLSLPLKQVHLTGIFSKDGKKVEHARMTGVFNPKVVGENDGSGVCRLLRSECEKDANGKLYVRLAVKLSSIPNPLPYSMFITEPIYLETSVDGSKPLDFYTTETIDEKSLVAKVWSCTGSKDEQKPCDKDKGADVTEIKEKGIFKLKDSKKQGTYTPPKLKSDTWYKIELKSKSGKAVAFSTHLIFKVR